MNIQHTSLAPLLVYTCVTPPLTPELPALLLPLLPLLLLLLLLLLTTTDGCLLWTHGPHQP
jgi:hypothetical protein